MEALAQANFTSQGIEGINASNEHIYTHRERERKEAKKMVEKTKTNFVRTNRDNVMQRIRLIIFMIFLSHSLFNTEKWRE